MNKIDLFFPGLGYDRVFFAIGNPISPLQMYRAGDVRRVEYDFIL